MKNLTKLLVASLMVAGISSAASANCCVTSCCTVTKCIQETVKLVPYQVCETVCVPVTDSCGNVCGYKQVKQYKTKYKRVVEKKVIDCCCCN